MSLTLIHFKISSVSESTSHREYLFKESRLSDDVISALTRNEMRFLQKARRDLLILNWKMLKSERKGNTIKVISSVFRKYNDFKE